MRIRGVRKISLSVAPENLAAVKLYQRFGFQAVGKIDTSITMVVEIGKQ
ncbi:GNAT family N-acetyltransferase [Paenibacillus lentus]|nr:GNAT family N-acetyltransferase [Paenibacillus lentus]